MNQSVIFPAAEKVILQDTGYPEPKKGEVVIRSECSLISTGTEMTFLKGECPKNSKWSSYIHYPMTSGYSVAGTVEAVGEGVSTEWIGRRVASFSHHAQYVAAPERELREIHYEIPPEEAAFFAMAEVGLNGIRRTRVELGSRVVVYGAGIIGQLLVRFLLAGGCTEIVVADVAETRLGFLPDSPAVIPVCSKIQSVLEKVRRVTYGQLADIVFETTGNADLIPYEFEVLHQQGKLCMLSSPKKKTWFDFHDFCNAGSIQIIGAHTSAQAPVATYDNPWTCARNSEVFFKMIHNRQIDISNLISHHASFEQAPDMYQMLLKDRSQAMGVVLHWSDSALNEKKKERSGK